MARDLRAFFTVENGRVYSGERRIDIGPEVLFGSTIYFAPFTNRRRPPLKDLRCVPFWFAGQLFWTSNAWGWSYKIGRRALRMIDQRAERPKAFDDFLAARWELDRPVREYFFRVYEKQKRKYDEVRHAEYLRHADRRNAKRAQAAYLYGRQFPGDPLSDALDEHHEAYMKSMFVLVNEYQHAAREYEQHAWAGRIFDPWRCDDEQHRRWQQTRDELRERWRNVAETELYPR